MEKVIRDGKVAVIYSPGFGSGWSSWNENQSILFHPKLVEMVEAGKLSQITEEWVCKNIGISGVYCAGAETLTICWLPEGTAFMLLEHDGFESIHTSDDLTIIA